MQIRKKRKRGDAVITETLHIQQIPRDVLATIFTIRPYDAKFIRGRNGYAVSIYAPQPIINKGESSSPAPGKSPPVP